MALTKPLAVSTCLLSGVFLALGSLFVAFPAPASAFYGLPTSDPAALFYVRAIGFRDLALGVYLIGLVLAGLQRALSIVLTATLLIPTGDLLLLASSGTGQPVHYLLHGGSLFCFAGLALWTRRSALAR